ncbi:HMG (high mobility group) box domain containing protein [Entamoeba histolytica HM-3:IMSS]|uniref:High mobility group (HMG) box domain containing protein n=3 Tax=Entamoeba histolytica TaxID=5759 RepID=C4MB43_ENTH1|nr:high mobility group (HMG) box domain containing protein [Entamoeba histolytica HM-1:IMSS]EAL49051.1 high mobility group (HMG) box domain containing protein [Entamoeba histolytica HM-1:IMSS]EMS11060.1 HMG (high mobility group) box domain containing protein [Entamoeba histolytica HM-3:IMSS]GAT99125.1 high mobility group hmg box domain containing protein [Entamoeba histolytica]|eukprot:XP_654437.1 high mobility group (HMG) box domain containing protein [Entamoeba histolytica HM-1:IMSS]
MSGSENTKKPRTKKQSRKYIVIKSKKGKNPYIKFCQEKREEVKAANPDLKPKEITSKLVEIWNGMNEEEKAKFKPKPRVGPKGKLAKKEEEPPKEEVKEEKKEEVTKEEKEK